MTPAQLRAREFVMYMQSYNLLPDNSAFSWAHVIVAERAIQAAIDDHEADYPSALTAQRHEPPGV